MTCVCFNSQAAQAPAAVRARGKNAAKRPHTPPPAPSSDDSTSSSSSDSDSSDTSSDSDAHVSAAAARPASGAAWSDSDDDGVSVNIAAKSRLRKLRKTEEETSLGGSEYSARLRTRFAETHGAPEWAVSAPEDDAGITHTGALVGKSAGLMKDLLEVVRQRDANHENPSKAVIQSTQFHPSGQLLLTAGFDQTLRLFQVCTH